MREGEPVRQDDSFRGEPQFERRETPDRGLKEKIERQRPPMNSEAARMAFTNALRAANDNGSNVVLLEGEPGSGKSAYAPGFTHDFVCGQGLPRRTVIMEPRRDAAMGVGQAVAAVTDNVVGGKVGVSTSEINANSPDTEIASVTSGVFLRYLQEGSLHNDRAGAAFIDEAHEESLDYHISLGLLKMAHEKGEAPLTVLTSATMNQERLRNYFDIPDEAMVRVEGRTHRVQTQFLDEYDLHTEDDYGFQEERNYLEVTAEQIKEASTYPDDGDILVFVPGAREIRDLTKRLGEIEDFDVLPLSGSQKREERAQALAEKNQGDKRRIILSTNIAETSVTVPGVTCVVDTCRKRSMVYNPKTGVDEEITEFISQDEATQREGRAGRVQPGRCIRILDEERFGKLPQHQISEIHRANLSKVVLRLKGMGIDPQEFPFIDPPDPNALQAGEEELVMLGAIDDNGELTPLGEKMAELPFDPRYGRMIVESAEQGCLEQGLVLAAFSRESGDVYSRSRGWGRNVSFSRQGEPETAQERWRNEHGVEIDYSDMVRDCMLFADAIENGVFEASNGRGPEQRRAYQNFRVWCDENNVHANTLIHIARNMNEYLRHMQRSDHFQDEIQTQRFAIIESLRQIDRDKLGVIALSAFPDKLLVEQGNRDHIPRYDDIVNRYEIVLSPGSEAFNYGPELCVAQKFEDGKGTLGHKDASNSRNTTRTYAHGVHPVSLEQILKHAPQMVETVPEEAAYNSDVDRVMRQVVVNAKSGDRHRIGITWETLENQDDIGPVLASAIMNRTIELPVHEENRDLLRSLRARSEEATSEFGLEQWYRDHINDMQNKADLVARSNELRLSPSDVCPADQLAEIERTHPSQITIHGSEFMVDYTRYRKRDHDGDSQLMATIVLDESILFDLADDDFSEIEDWESGLTIQYAIPPTDLSALNPQRTRADSLEDLKGQVDERRLQSAFITWKQEHDNGPRSPAQIDPTADALPDPADVGYPPREFATNYKGEPVYATPVLIPDFNGYRFYVDYRYEQRSISEGRKKANEAFADKKKREGLKEAQETLLEPAFDALREVEKRIAQLNQGTRALRFDALGGEQAHRAIREAQTLLNPRPGRIGARAPLPDVPAAIQHIVTAAKIVTGIEQAGQTLRMNEHVDHSSVVLDPESGVGKLEATLVAQTSKFQTEEAAPTPKPEKIKRVMDETIRSEIVLNIESLGSMVNSLEAVANDASTEGKTGQARSRVIEKIEGIRNQLSNLQEDVTEAASDETAEQYENRVRQLSQSIDSLTKQNAHQLVANYDKGWKDSYDRLVANISTVLQDNELAQDVITSGTAEHDLRQKMLQKLGENISNLMQGGTVDLDDMVLEVVDELTS